MKETNYAVPPGEYLLEWMEEEGVPRREVAGWLGRQGDVEFVDDLIAGKVSVDGALAGLLSSMTGIPVDSWLRWEEAFLQDQRDLAYAAEERRENVRIVLLLAVMGFAVVAVDSLIVAAFIAVGFPVVGWVVGSVIAVWALGCLLAVGYVIFFANP